MTRLLDLQHRYNYGTTPNPEDHAIATALHELSTNENHTDHLRSLAFMQLVCQLQENRTTLLTNEEACAGLRTLIRKTTLRPNIRLQAEMLLASFQLRKAPNEDQDLHLALLAHRCLNNFPFQEMGLAVDKLTWAKSTLVRLLIENRTHAIPIDTAFDYATDLADSADLSPSQQRFFQYARAHLRFQNQGDFHGDRNGQPVRFTDRSATLALQRLLAQETDPNVLLTIRLLLAKMHLAGRTPPQTLTDVDALRIAQIAWKLNDIGTPGWFDAVDLLAKLPVAADDHPAWAVTALRQALQQPLAAHVEARYLLLLASWHLKTALVSREEAISVCERVYETLAISQNLRDQAAQLLRQLHGAALNEYPAQS